MAFEAEIKAMLDATSLFASAKADDERFNDSTIPAFETAKLFNLLLSECDKHSY